MRRTLVTCDWCGKEAEVQRGSYMDLPYGWFQITVAGPRQFDGPHEPRTTPLATPGWNLTDLPYGVNLCGKECAHAYLHEAERLVKEHPVWEEQENAGWGVGAPAQAPTATPYWETR